MLGDEKGWSEIRLTSAIPSRRGICVSIPLLSFLTLDFASCKYCA